MRIGLIGTESDHAVDFLRMLNAMERSPGDRIVAIWGEDEARTQDVAQKFGAVSVKQRPEDVAGEVDAALLVSRYGSLHLSHALPFVTKGLPVFIDKPLACSLGDADGDPRCRETVRCARDVGERAALAARYRGRDEQDRRRSGA